MKQYFYEYGSIAILSILLLVTRVMKYLISKANESHLENDSDRTIKWKIFGIFREMHFFMLPIGMIIFSIIDFISDTNTLPAYIIVYFLIKTLFIIKKIRKM